jgi:hypothetical protein
MSGVQHVPDRRAGQPVPGQSDERQAASPHDERHATGPHDERDAAGPHDERHSEFRQVECGRCGAVVLVAKFSPQHTSVQWSPASVGACAEFTDRTAGGEQTALIDTCASLRDSIERAVRDGRLQISPP